MCLPSKACGRAICGLATVERASTSNAALGTGLRRYDEIETLAAILRCRAGMTGWRAGAFAHLSTRTNAAGPKPAHRKPRPLVIPAKAGIQIGAWI